MRRIGTLVIVLALVGTACTLGGDDAMTESTEAGMDEFAATTVVTFDDAGEAEAPADGERFGSGGVSAEPIVQVDLGRDIIFTAEVTVAVGDVAAAGAQATEAVQSLGGFLFGQQSTGGAEARSTLVFKIDPANFQAALAALGDIGEVRNQRVTADDVTERVVDLESRITTAAASVERLRALLEGATDIDTIADIEEQLLQRETTLETLRGQLRTLQDAVALATITVHLTEAISNPALQVQVTSYPGIEDDGASCPGGGGSEVLEGEPVTVCFEIANVGDTLLTGFTLRDAVLDIELDDLLVVWGDPTAELEPGQSLVLATETVLDRSLRTQTRITAIPVNDDGTPVEAREVAATTALFLTAVDPGGLPGFADGLEASWGFLQDLGGLVVLAAGIVIPFLWLIAIALGITWWRRRNATPTDPPTPEPQPEPEPLEPAGV